MKPPRLRPTFVVPLPWSCDEAMDRIRTAVEAHPELAELWNSRGRWADLSLPPAEQRIWSPHLSLRLDEATEGCILFGRFAPRPEVWTFFMFVYFAVAFLALLGGILGYVQWVSHEPAWGLWAVWAGIPALALLHLISALGQRLGHDQMVRLRGQLDAVLDEVARAGGGP